MRLLVAVDGSPFTKRMLGYLTAQSEWLLSGHEVTLLTVVPPVPPRAAATLDRELLKGYYEDEAEKVFKPVRSLLTKQGFEVKYLFKVGHAAETIAKTAEAGKFELLVMGSHGHSSLGNLVMGSVATRVLAECKTPALLVR